MSILVGFVILFFVLCIIGIFVKDPRIKKYRDMTDEQLADEYRRWFWLGRTFKGREREAEIELKFMEDEANRRVPGLGTKWKDEEIKKEEKRKNEKRVPKSTNYQAAQDAINKYWDHVNGTSNKPKDASVVGRAIVGGALAGSAGAVVGALSAVDKNNRNANKSNDK